MAVVMGTSAGFCSSRPSGDPNGTAKTGTGRGMAQKDTSDATATKVTEIGFYMNQNIAAGVGFDVGIYTHNVGDDNPEAIVSAIHSGNTGTTAGWKYVTGLDIAISASTVYWAAYQMDAASVSTIADETDDAGEKHDYTTASSTDLLDPWGVSSGTSGRIYAIYAVWSAAGAAGGHMTGNKYRV